MGELLPKGVKVSLLSVFDVAPVDLYVLVSVRARVLVVEAHGVHHLVLDVARQVGTRPDVDGLVPGDGPISPTNVGVAQTGILKLNVNVLKEEGGERTSEQTECLLWP